MKELKNKDLEEVCGGYSGVAAGASGLGRKSGSDNARGITKNRNSWRNRK